MEIDSDDGLVAVNEIEDIHIQREPSFMVSKTFIYQSSCFSKTIFYRAIV